MPIRQVATTLSTFAFVSLTLTVGLPATSKAFCGFYVAKAGTNLFNKASKVVLVRHDGKTVITMANDYRGPLKEFAIVIPVPSVLKRRQINVTNNKLVDHLDAYTAPRLVEYFDKDPCRRRYRRELRKTARSDGASRAGGRGGKGLGVKIEAQYTVGEYDIAILSAKQSGGLQIWLKQEGYQVPEKARPVLASYIAKGMKFFVARVNLKEQAKAGFTYLRPLQIAFESKGFMLPIRLGMINANGEQELFAFTITRNGRVESTNYRNARIPSNFNVPLYLKTDFPRFYKDMFTTIAKREGKGTIFTEYAWNMAWCDPCAAAPLSPHALRQLGVFWVDYSRVPANMMKRSVRRWWFRAPAYVTRLHMRYTAASHPDDLRFVETNDRRNYQGRYIMRHPWKGRAQCRAAVNYLKRLPDRFEREAQNLARATGWDINTIRARMEKTGQSFKPADIQWRKRPFWERIWPNRSDR